MDKCDFELLLRRPLRESQGRLLSLMHAGRIPHFLHFALGGPVTDEATYRAQHDKNLRTLENGFYEPLPPVFPTQETAFSVLPPAQSKQRVAAGYPGAGIEHRPNSSLYPGTGCTLSAEHAHSARAGAPFLSICYNDRRQTMLPARMQMYTRACAALRRLNPCWTYIWNAWKRCPSANRATAIWLTRPSAAWRNACTKTRCRCRRFPTMFSSFSYNPPVSGFLIKRVWD